MLPSPNHRMNTGTQASDGIGISALTSGRKKFSTGWKRAIRMPSGRPTSDGQRDADQHAVERASRVREHGAVEQHGHQRRADLRQRRHQHRREIAAARDRFVEQREHDERDRGADVERARRHGARGVRRRDGGDASCHHPPAQHGEVARAAGTRASPARGRCTPITATPASITSVLRNSRAPKIIQPRPHGTAASISTPTRMRQACASPSRRPVRM